MTHFFEKEVFGEKIEGIAPIRTCESRPAPIFRRTCLKNQKERQNRAFCSSSAPVGFGAAQQLWPNLA
ncbi:hypothetical protein [Pararhizobium sp. DWP1-1-3]|uniref:hypothetical protein n=1 Tax=Pararhizobium sp. DWP1-1-3 TaxID=2804652 RepID=UPI003CFA42C9